MSRRSVMVFAASAALLLAACTSSGAASDGAGTSATSTTAPIVSASPTIRPSASPILAPPATAEPTPTVTPSSSLVSSPAPEACKETRRTPDVRVAIVEYEFKPATVEATVGQVIGFRSSGVEPHTATPDGGGCSTKTVETGQTDGLVFSAAGSYPFHCSIHPWMTGTIKIGG